MTRWLFQHTAARRRLGLTDERLPESDGFNTQPPEGGWGYVKFNDSKGIFVSTHSRPKAAGSVWVRRLEILTVSTHSRPKAAGQIHSKSKTI